MALEDLTPAVRVESILNGDEITPANRLEYFLQKAATELPKPAAGDAGKVLAVNEDADGAEWKTASMLVGTSLSGTVYTFDKTFEEIYNAYSNGIPVFVKMTGGPYNTYIGSVLSVRNDPDGDPPCWLTLHLGDPVDCNGNPDDYPSINYD